MIAAGLPAKASKLALPGCKSNRQTFCDGAAHRKSLMVDQFGTEVVTKAVATNVPVLRAL